MCSILLCRSIKIDDELWQLSTLRYFTKFQLATLIETSHMTVHRGNRYQNKEQATV